MGEITRSHYKTRCKSDRQRHNNFEKGSEFDPDSEQDDIKVESYECDVCLRRFSRKCAYIQHKSQPSNCLLACQRANANGHQDSGYLPIRKRARKDSFCAKILESEESSDSEDDCETVKCIICDQHFKSLEELTNHVVQDHDDDSELSKPSNPNPSPQKPAKCDEIKRRKEDGAADLKPNLIDFAELIDFDVPLAKYSQVPIRMPKNFQRKKILTQNFRVSDIWKIEKPKVNTKLNISTKKAEEKVSLEPKRTEEKVIPKPNKIEENVALKPMETHEKVSLKATRIEEKVALKPSRNEEKVVPKPTKIEENIAMKPTETHEKVVLKGTRIEERVALKPSRNEEKVVPKPTKIEENVAMKSTETHEKVVPKATRIKENVALKPTKTTKETQRVLRSPEASKSILNPKMEEQKVSLDQEINESIDANIRKERETLKFDNLEPVDDENRKHMNVFKEVKDTKKNELVEQAWFSNVDMQNVICRRETLECDNVEHVEDKNLMHPNVSKQVFKTNKDIEEINEFTGENSLSLLNKVDAEDAIQCAIDEKEVDLDEYFEFRSKNFKPGDNTSTVNSRILDPEDIIEPKPQSENTDSSFSKEDDTRVTNTETLNANSDELLKKLPKSLKVVIQIMKPNACVEKRYENKEQQEDDNKFLNISKQLVSRLFSKGLRINARKQTIHKKIINQAICRPVTSTLEMRTETDRSVAPLKSNGAEMRYGTLKDIINRSNETKEIVLDCSGFRKRRVPRILEVKPMVRCEGKVLTAEKNMNQSFEEKPKRAVEPLSKASSFLDNNDLHRVVSLDANQRTPKTLVKETICTIDLTTPDTNPSFKACRSISNKNLEVSRPLNKAMKSPDITNTVITEESFSHDALHVNATSQTTDTMPYHLRTRQSTNRFTQIGRMIIKRKPLSQKIYRDGSPKKCVPLKVIRPTPTSTQDACNLLPSSTSVLGMEVSRDSNSTQLDHGDAQRLSGNDSATTINPNDNVLTTTVNQTVAVETPNAEFDGYHPNNTAWGNAVACNYESTTPLLQPQVNAQTYTPFQMQIPQYFMPVNIMQWPTANPVLLMDTNTICAQQPANVHLYQNQADSFTQIQSIPAVAVSVINGIQQPAFTSLPSYVTVCNPMAAGFQLVQDVNPMNYLPYVVV